ncbi:MAG: hypothetical protein AAF950_02545 [Pseudomonadota bacterium]
MLETLGYSHPIELDFSDPTNLTADAFVEEGLDSAFGATVTEQIESRSDLALQIGYRKDRFNVFAAGTNLLDIDAVRSVSFGTVSSETAELDIDGGGLSGLLFPPRSFRLGIEVNF